MSDPWCPCNAHLDTSAIVGCHLVSTPQRSEPLVRCHGEHMHLHEVLVTDPRVLTWRGFLAYKLRRFRPEPDTAAMVAD